MQADLNSEYQTYLLSELDSAQGSILSPLQRAVLQNHRMNLIVQKVTLATEGMTQHEKDEYWQQEAYLRGQIDLLTFMFNASDAAVEALAADSSQPDSSTI